MNFKKRRHQKTINKNDQKVRRARTLQDRPSLGVLYPYVQKLSVQLNFFSPEGSLLLEQSRDFGPEDRVDLTAPCPGRCGYGEMDLEGKLRDIISSREMVSESRALCRQPIYADSAVVCGCELRCRIDVTYRSQ